MESKLPPKPSMRVV